MTRLALSLSFFASVYKQQQDSLSKYRVHAQSMKTVPTTTTVKLLFAFVYFCRKRSRSLRASSAALCKKSQSGEISVLGLEGVS